MRRGCSAGGMKDTNGGRKCTNARCRSRGWLLRRHARCKESLRGEAKQTSTGAGMSGKMREVLISSFRLNHVLHFCYV